MSNKIMEQEDRCFVIYNSGTQERVGIFLGPPAAKFIFGYKRKGGSSVTHIHVAAHSKAKISKLEIQLDFIPAIRYGKKEDWEKLGNADFYLYDVKYEKYILNSMKTSDVSRTNMAIGGNIRAKKYRENKNNNP